MNKRILIPLLTLLISLSASAQRLKKFSSDPVVYSEELQKFLTDRDKDRGELIWAEISPMLNDGTFEGVQFDHLVSISNNLLKKRVLDVEVWYALFASCKTISNLDSETDYYSPFLDDLASFSKKNKSRDTDRYLRTLLTCTSDSALFDDGKIRWVNETGGYEFRFENETPQFIYEDIDLWGYYKTDSTQIVATAGVYYPKTNEFKGLGGEIYWIRAGISKDSLYAELGPFTVDMTKGSYRADSTILYSSYYVTEPIYGVFEERLTSRSGADKAIYPRFRSYESNVLVTDFVPGVDYKGGYSLMGNKVFASGAEGQKAEFIFKYEGSPQMKIRANRFLLNKNFFSAEEGYVWIKLGDADSLFHPKSSMRYVPEKKVLTVTRVPEGMSKAPYGDTYHDVDIYFENLTWKLTDSQFYLGNLNMGSVSPVFFESENYFRGERYSAVQGLADVNPLVNIADVTRYYGSTELNIEQMADGLRMDKLSTHRMMMQMAIQGFVFYNIETGDIRVKNKTFDYILNYKGDRDYDVIRFVSAKQSGVNASVSLLNYDMEIQGISGIALSDSQKVVMYPYGKIITLHEGLDFDFDGKIAAGRFSFWGQEFFFDYDQFRVNMSAIDSMRFKVESFTATSDGRRSLVDVKTVLQNINGELLIDKANNKSGLEQYHEYPIFKSGRESYIYYDRKDIHGGVYDRERFYVEIAPFEIDSLDNASTAGLKFDGTFTSAGIFPEMQQEMTVQKDYSLGFETTTPPTGLVAYGGVGTFTNKLTLSNQGLRGDGTIDYLTSRAASDDFIFFPDSTNGIAQSFEIQPQMANVEYPHVVGRGVKYHWEPLQDILYTTSRDSAFAMYDDIGMKTVGTLDYSPQRLGGDALISYLDAENKSKDFTFKNRMFESPEMSFRVRANATAPWGFSLENARGFVNFELQKGEFAINDSASFMSFPINQYTAFMDFAEWQIPEKSLEVKKQAAPGIPASKMISVHKRQDSLQYMASGAKFYLENSLLEGFGVPVIEVADASIVPDSGYVAIDPGAQMRQLEHAQITAQRANQFHKFFEGSIKISSRKKYAGSADYEYIDDEGTPWPLHFKTIKVDTSGTTIGTATVAQEDGFYMSPFFEFYGKVELNAKKRHLFFNGYTLIQQVCDNISTTWFKFKSEIDPNKIVIILPEDNPSTRADNLYNGIYISPDSTSGYSAFLSRESSKADMEIVSATGVLFYDNELSSYIVTTQEKLDNPDGPGNYLALDNDNCVTVGRGALTFGKEMGQLEFAPYGEVQHNLDDGYIEGDVVINMDFHFSEPLLEAITAKLKEATSLSGADVGRKAYRDYLGEAFSSEKDRAEFWTEINNTGFPEKMPRELSHTISFTDVQMEYNPETSSFVSVSDIGIGSIGRTPINRKVEGYLEVIHKRRGDEFYLYFTLDNKQYYFQYKRNVLSFYTDDKPTMLILQETDSDDRSVKAKDGKPPFTYNQASKGKMRLFLSKFEE